MDKNIISNGNADSVTEVSMNPKIEIGKPAAKCLQLNTCKIRIREFKKGFYY